MKEDLIYQRMLEADESRGHRFIGPEKIPALNATKGTKLAERVAAAHYYIGDFEWFVLELDLTDGHALTFRTDKLTGREEFGYTNLFRLGQQIVKSRVGIASGYEVVHELFIERDCEWTPTVMSEVRLMDGTSLLN